MVEHLEERKVGFFSCREVNRGGWE